MPGLWAHRPCRRSGRNRRLGHDRLRRVGEVCHGGRFSCCHLALSCGGFDFLGLGYVKHSADDEPDVAAFLAVLRWWWFNGFFAVCFVGLERYPDHGAVLALADCAADLNPLAETANYGHAR